MSLLISTKQSAESHAVIKPAPLRMRGDHQERKAQKNTGHTHTHTRTLRERTEIEIQGEQESETLTVCEGCRERTRHEKVHGESVEGSEKLKNDNHVWGHVICIFK